MNTGLNRTKWEPYVWLLPSILLIAIFVVFPILIVFKLSFSEISKADVIGGFIGFDNYVEAVHLPAFKTVMLNTLWWVLSVVILSTLLGFIIAMVLNQKFHGQKIARAIMVFPWATSLVIQASVWNYIIKAEYGNLNNVLLNLGIIRQAINWRSTGAPVIRSNLSGNAGSAFSSRFRLSPSVCSPACSPSTDRSMRRPPWTGRASGTSCAISRCRWSGRLLP